MSVSDKKKPSIYYFNFIFILSYLKIAVYAVGYRHICFKILSLLGFPSGDTYVGRNFPVNFPKAVRTLSTLYLYHNFFLFSAVYMELIYDFDISQAHVGAGKTKSREGQDFETDQVVCILGLSIFSKPCQNSFFLSGK